MDFLQGNPRGRNGSLLSPLNRNPIGKPIIMVGDKQLDYPAAESVNKVFSVITITIISISNILSIDVEHLARKTEIMLLI